ncbi:hypothetical protein NUU61_007560 [Penicillium alfredii]|uniref:Xylanolytic transcriptional activator regulatory domain-containing protein n=1 Tax=Penicillium alfredii TaxID=1506179 RepID=A0A9W9EQP5_9EURO|nr:uncharacterized protein NUU61_007560 [Penicillium alfredii]KAJ5086253.1 hypothetical protein NUU61_007560 [Penicillium alfredii]
MPPEKLRDSDRVTDRWATDKSIGHIGLLLATLAAGAHYSDVGYSQRLKTSTDFARRSFHALQLANFLFRPSLNIIQALLILGNTLQNTGQSDAGYNNSTGSDHGAAYRKKSSIVWQDSLCLCYDRPPIVSVAGWTLDESFYQRQDLSYAEIMHFICRLGLDIMQPEHPGVTEADRALEALHKLDAVYQRGKAFLHAREASLPPGYERVQRATSIGVGIYWGRRTFTGRSLIDASRAFLDFQALSIIPLRSWSMVHTALSSTLLLCIWEETRNDPDCRRLQQQVIDVFFSSNARASDEGDSNSDSDNQWLYRQEEAGAVNHEDWSGQGLNAGVLGAGMPGWYLDMANPMDISPASYLDSIMNAPLFDFSQRNEYL